ncbi:hypothetical protein FD50_GL000752 [Liquorilactobacillus satsumensis DSM 16230 = JCM 12392]|uniref:Uncharacterized protein n=1 Tax=Liquorilactobacillus satsumensis DSM 16230 = JCM 12392 TaxID=1423801 RepID=A0A0R1V050_9LACO|nr:hypothetical protein FD50_GL000752 [Liquorilactobacillus satsumensis DSM 16230 = JCM 12392]
MIKKTLRHPNVLDNSLPIGTPIISAIVKPIVTIAMELAFFPIGAIWLAMVKAITTDIPAPEATIILEIVNIPTLEEK